MPEKFKTPNSLGSEKQLQLGRTVFEKWSSEGLPRTGN